MALAALGTAAVLDVGSRAAEAAPSASPFAGSWSGTWAIAALQKGGTFEWTISDAGRISGTVVTTTFGTSGTIVGHVGDDGNIMMIGYVPNDAPSTGQNGSPFQGTAAIDGGGKLVASMTGMFNAFPNNHVDGWLVATLERN
jgi:hypothetical protein